MATPQSIFSTSAPETPRETAQGGPLLVINATVFLAHLVKTPLEKFVAQVQRQLPGRPDEKSTP